MQQNTIFLILLFRVSVGLFNILIISAQFNEKFLQTLLPHTKSIVNLFHNHINLSRSFMR